MAAGFQLKNFVSIVASMVNHVRSTTSLITDFNVGGKFRTLIEAAAIEIDQLYQQLFNIIMAAIPVATYNSFNFPLLPPVAASGIINITCTSLGTPTTYAAGSVFTSQTAQTSYVSTETVTVPPSTTSASIPVAATTPGALGNLAAGAAFTMAATPAGFVSATNSAAFSNGQDQETDDQRARRFVSFITTLSRGTVDALEYGATTAIILDAGGNIIEQVKAVSVVEINLLSLSLSANIPPVNIYVHNGVGGTSAALVALALQVLTGYTNNLGVRIPGWKAAGIPITVAAATEVPINHAGTITVANGYSLSVVQAAAVAALEAYVLGLNINATYSFSQGVALIQGIPGVTDYVPSTPTADVTSTTSQKLMPGTFSFISPSVGSATGAAVVTAVG